MTWALLVCAASSAHAAQNASSAPNAFKGFVPGEATRGQVTRALGRPGMTRGDSDWYLVPGEANLTDRLYFGGRPAKLGLVTAGSTDPRYPTREAIVAALGRPEATVRFETQELLDYSEKGLRFICDASGKTTGVVYFIAGRRRVPDGYPSRFDLRHKAPTAEPAKPPADFRVGGAQISIAPQRLDDVAADAKEKRYTVHEDLLARVAIFERGDNRIVLAGLDVFGMAPWDLRTLRRSLAQKGFDQVVVAMSHTHANVDTIGFYGYYPKAYAQHIVRQTERAVLAAAERMKPVKLLKIGSTEMPLAGGRVVDLVRNGRNDGIVDPTVSVIQAIGTDGRPIVNVIHLACHPEIIRREDKRGLSPDYVGTLCTEVARELGGQPVFLNGALGGMLTPDAPVRGYESAAVMGKGFARFVLKAARAARPTSSYGLWFHRRPVEYPITSKAILQFLEHAPGPVDIREGRVRTEMNAVWIGDAQMITVPGELLPELGFEIMAQMTGGLRLIVGLANDEFGYLIPSYDFRKGQYEERTGPGAAGGVITRMVGLELAQLRPPSSEDAMRIHWDKDILTIAADRLPGGRVQVWYLEAFCRRGSTDRDWRETTIPFKTERVAADPDGRWLKLKTLVDGKVEVTHDIRSSADDVTFDVVLTNTSRERVDIEWAQPCIRVGEFTGRKQEDYYERCFIFTERGLTQMHQTHRETHARYVPGQVYVPEGIDLNDVNPRPVSKTRPVNGLVGCFSADDRMILATAWSRTQELFQGVIVCIHNDPHIGGLTPGETKRLHGKLYLVPNDVDRLLRRYDRDFPKKKMSE